MKHHHRRGDWLTRAFETVEDIADWALLIGLCLTASALIGGLIALAVIIHETPTP